MVNGEWWMVDGEWWMVNGGWWMVDGATNSKFKIQNYQKRTLAVWRSPAASVQEIAYTPDARPVLTLP